MIYCLNCNQSLNQDGNVDFIVKCGRCFWFNRFRHAEIKEKERVKKSFIEAPNLHIKQFENGILYTYHFDIRNIRILKGISQRTGQALEKFIYYDKKQLSNQEKNILYKFKAHNISEIEEKISYLEAKKKCIEILRSLEF